ncbi:MAG: hypothetical protein IJQ02_05390 [Oscillospiraceae bacterium]|nr:hypothetical protein [Oscillospiraceae bacterium]MBR0392161.1 hypothetical protein [Oscillospiraceae bacterium]
MEIKIMLAAAIFFGGWLWFYLFMRQLFFNYMTAYPLMRRMRNLDPDLIAIGANRYTTISTVFCAIASLIILAVIIRFCPLYLKISFSVGAILCCIMLLPKLSYRNRTMFDSFCAAYCRFVPDDSLRTAMYNKDVKAMNRRLREMDFGESFIPEFHDK